MLVTGGSGLLGTELKKFIPDAHYPGHQEFDVTNVEQMDEYIRRVKPDTIIHAAAFTSPPIVAKDPEKALNVNIIGTANIVKLCVKYDIKLVYICTDYVFSGNRGEYSEDDEMHPQNKYAWSKLGGECAVRLYDNSLIIRTSFGDNEFPFPKAYVDQWTSRLTVTEFAEILAKVAHKVANEDLRGVLHIGQERLTVYEWAKKISPEKEIGTLRRDEVDFPVPEDTSLNLSKMQRILND